MEKHSGENLEWDLKGAAFFHPFYLAPLAIYKQNCGNNITCKDIPSRISKYLELVQFEDPLLIKEDMDLASILEPYVPRSYIPVCKFELCKSNIDALQTILQRVICKQRKSDIRITTP